MHFHALFRFLCHFLGNCLGRLCVVVCVVFSVVNDYLHKNKIQQDLRFLCQISLIKHRFGKKVRHRARHFTSFFLHKKLKFRIFTKGKAYQKPWK